MVGAFCFPSAGSCRWTWWTWWTRFGLAPGKTKADVQYWPVDLVDLVDPVSDSGGKDKIDGPAKSRGTLQRHAEIAGKSSGVSTEFGLFAGPSKSSVQ